LSLFLGGARAQEPQWRPAAPRPAKTVPTEGKPLPCSTGVTLGRPQPLEEPRPSASGHPSPQDALVSHAVYRPALESAARPLFRAKLLDDNLQPQQAAAAQPADDEPIYAAVTDFASDRPAGLLRVSYLETLPELSANDPCQACPPGPGWNQPRTLLKDRLEFSAEYLLWWVEGYDLPPLVTTSPPEVPQNQQGAIGPNTAILFGNQNFNPEGQSGGRFNVRYWFDRCAQLALEGNFFFLAQRSQGFFADSSTIPVLARPIQIQNLGGVEGRQLVASPGINPGDVLNFRGNISVDGTSELWGAEANLRRKLCCGCDWKVDVLAGYRFLRLREGLSISEDIVTLRDIPGIPVFAGDRIVVTDSFDTRNEFHGGQLGVSGELRRGPWSLEGTFKLALGVTHQVININGSTTITSPQGVVTNRFNAGLLAVASNSGEFSRDRFAVVPEVGLRLGYNLTENLRVFAGYNFLYWSSVVRPGDQIDRLIDVTQVPFFTTTIPPVTSGQVRPVVPFRDTDFWAQGMSFGIELRY
jgi:hypothetical protein